MPQAPSSAARPLRVLHVISMLTGGGAEKFLCALASAFDESAVHTGIMPVYPTSVPFDEAELRRISIIPIARRSRYDPGFLGRMLRGVRQFKPDIVHAHLHNGKYWGRLAALAARVPIVIFTEHSPQGEKRIIPEILVDEVLNRVTDGVITFTQRQRSMLEKNERIPPGKLRVIENGIPLPPPPDARRRSEARAQLCVEEDGFAIFVVGRLEPIKNMQLAVRAMRELPDARPRIHLYIAGDGSEMNPLRDLAVTQEVTARVTFLGHRRDAVHLLCGADVLFLPSLVEGMPLAALEAMTSGVPVMSTPWAGSEELLAGGRLGVVLADWNPRTAARAFQEAAANESALREMAQRALDFARGRYDIRRAAREHERFYTELATRKGLRTMDWKSRELSPTL
jgi:glycosyltransferase involved in cell wall biosynthesis